MQTTPLLPSSDSPAVVRIKEYTAAHPMVPDCDRFYFLRHGQTARNAAKIFQGPDEPLDATGIEQAKRAAALLAAVPLASIVCSSMQRAVQTAHIVALSHPRVPVQHAALRERNFGVLIGTSSAAIDWNCAPENGETLEQFVVRTRDGLAFALAQPAQTLVVAHGGTLYVLAGLLRVGLPLALLANATPLCFTREGRKWRVATLSAAPPVDAQPNIA